MSSEPEVFATTRWTLVQRARGETPEARAALAELCEAYWMPVYRFLRREGRTDDEARELAQDFFAKLLSGAGVGAADPGRGRFRSYLLGAVKHFLADVRERAERKKRGGGVEHESLDAPASGEGGGRGDPGSVGAARDVEDPAAALSDEDFDREWAVAVMDRALRSVEAEFSEARRAEQFAVLRGWLVGDAVGTSQAEAAGRLGISEGAVKVAVHRLRKRFREVIRSEIAQTLPAGADPEEELRYLVGVLGRNG